MPGTKVRILCVTDEFTRESLALEASRSCTSEQVCAVLERLFEKRSKPRALRMDNGPEFVALALQGLCYRQGIDPSHIEPGKPWQNGFAESFVSRLRDWSAPCNPLHEVLWSWPAKERENGTR